MDYTSLPTFPPPIPSRAATSVRTRDWRLTLRQTRVLIDLAKLAGIMALLLWMRQTAIGPRQPEPPPKPLPFRVVAERFDQVGLTMSRDEVVALLGPERFETLWEPEMREHDLLVWAHPDRYPEPRYWAKWADPDDRRRWVAVFICGGRVYKTLRRAE